MSHGSYWEDGIYVVVTQTGTILSRILKIITRAEYNHVSVTYDASLDVMYSFGRKNPYNPFWGGFVRESPHFGTFKRFTQTEAVVLCLPADAEKRQEVARRLEEMYRNRHDYGYNTLGLLLAAFRISYRRENRYYCSEFVKAFLEECQLISSDAVGRIPKPVEFLSLHDGKEIYRGKLRLYQRP